MKFEIGDKVVVKQTNDEGIVREIIDPKMVIVEVKGVRFPAHTDLLDFPYFNMFFKKEEPKPQKPEKFYIDQVKKEKPAPKYKVAEGVWLLLFPVFSRDVFDDDVVEQFKIYLVNQTDYPLWFTFTYYLRGKKELELKNDIRQVGDFYLMDIEFEQLNDGPSFNFEFTLKKPEKDKADFFEASYKPKAKMVFKELRKIIEEGTSFISQQLFIHYPDKIQEGPAESPAGKTLDLNKLNAAGFKMVNKKKFFAEAPPPSVLDLHIDKLLAHPGRMDEKHMLAFQLDELDKYLDKAFLHHLAEVNVIHGVGGGILKDEVHKLLRRHKHVSHYVHSFHPFFGYGATTAFLKI